VRKTNKQVDIRKCINRNKYQNKEFKKKLLEKRTKAKSLVNVELH
jgi:hypothetical protein